MRRFLLGLQPEQALLDAPARGCVLEFLGDCGSTLSLGATALQRLLLTATAYGVAVAFLNQPVEDPELRARIGRAGRCGERHDPGR